MSMLSSQCERLRDRADELNAKSEKGNNMKTYYMLTYDGKPITHIIIDNEEVSIITDEDCKPIFLDGKDCATKMCIALTWMMNDWDFGWERIYV